LMRFQNEAAIDKCEPLESGKDNLNVGHYGSTFAKVLKHAHSGKKGFARAKFTADYRNHQFAMVGTKLLIQRTIMTVSQAVE